MKKMSKGMKQECKIVGWIFLGAAVVVGAIFLLGFHYDLEDFSIVNFFITNTIITILLYQVDAYGYVKLFDREKMDKKEESLLTKIKRKIQKTANELKEIKEKHGIFLSFFVFCGWFMYQSGMYLVLAFIISFNMICGILFMPFRINYTREKKE